MNKLIAYCGLDCEKCEARIATVNQDESMKVKKTLPEKENAERQTRLTRLLEVPKFPLWLKILASGLGLLFVWLFITWAIWAMQTVVIPRVHGRSPGQVTQP